MRNVLLGDRRHTECLRCNNGLAGKVISFSCRIFSQHVASNINELEALRISECSTDTT